jgi:hypothetical protein
MPEAEAPEVDAPEDDAPEAKPDEDDGAGSKRAVLRDLARTRAEKKDIERQLAELRESSMSDQEKAIATAKAEARREALATVNLERVRDKVEAAAGARFADPEDAHHFLGELGHFIADDGTIDSKGIKKALDDLLKHKPYLAAGPKAGGSYDGGAGRPATPTDMSSLIRERAHR